MSGTKGIPLTKDEVMLLISLVESNPVIFSKVTNATNNKLKEEAWVKVTNHFNLLVESCPRKLEQLRLKWENLKKAARKRNARIRLRVEGGKPEIIPPDEALEKVANILGPGEGSDVYGDDVTQSEDVIVHMGEEIIGVSHVESDSVNKVADFISKAKQKNRKMLAEEIKSRIRRNDAVAEYYLQKSKRIRFENENILTRDKLNLEIEQLKVCKSKLELEILNLEYKKNNVSS